MRCYLQFLIWSCLLFLCHCTSQEKNQLNPTDFFANPKYPDRDYFKTLPLSNVDSCVKRIQEEVPSQWQEWTCESVYFRLPDSTSYATLFRYLDLCEQSIADTRIFCQLMRGRLFTKKAQYDTAYTCFQYAYQHSYVNKDTLRMADVQFELAKWASNRGDYPRSIGYLLEVNNVYQKIPKQDGRYFEVLIALGNTYKSFQDLEMSQLWFQKAWAYAYRYEWAEGFKITAAARVAEGYLLSNQLDSAQIFLDKAFYYQDLYKIDYEQDRYYWIQARIDLARSNCDKALINIEKALQLNPNKEDTRRIKSYEMTKGDAYECIGLQDKAASYYKASLLTTDSVAQQKTLEKLSILYQKQNKHDKAIEYKTQSEELAKRLFNKQKTKEIAILESKNEWIKREQAVEQQIKVKENTNKGLGIGLAFALVGLMIVSTILKKRHEYIEHLEETRKYIQQEHQKKADDFEQIQKNMHLQTSALETMTTLLELKETHINELIQNTTNDDLANSTEDPELHLRKMKILTADDWKQFYDMFEQFFPDFELRLKSQFPNLSPADTRLLILLKLKLKNAEIAETLAISINSVYKSRYRLRKKLGFTDEKDWDNFIIDL